MIDAKQIFDEIDVLLSNRVDDKADTAEKKRKPHEFNMSFLSVGANGYVQVNDSASSASLPNAFPLSVGTLTDSFFPQQSLSSAAKLELERELTDATAHIRHLDADNGGVLFARDWSSNGGVDGLFSFCPVPVLSEFKVTCGAATGDVSSLMDVHKVSFSEVRAAIESHSATAENSMSLKRAPSQSAEFHRGSSTNFPFTPGGFSVEQSSTGSRAKSAIDAATTASQLASLPDCRRLTAARGLSVGLTESCDEFIEAPRVSSSSSSSASLSSPLSTATIKPTTITTTTTTTVTTNNASSDDAILDQLLAGEIQPEALNNNNNSGNSASSATLTIPKEETLESLLHIDEATRKRLQQQRATSNQSAREWATMDSSDTARFREHVPNMALEFAFELDTFQKAAIMHIEKDESVLVAAHTSAGKTVVAEYAIALSAKRMGRALYTSPIKALSNQKFRDFRDRFGADQVGIVTGDISMNAEAPCLILTTEILRSMLYKGADLIRDVEWVIFDEVHYINDVERGVVWEEVIIMLPAHCNLLFLSATIPNALEFAEWVGRTKQRKVHVVATSKRPVPLEHFLYTSSNEMFLVRDRDGNFNSKNVLAAANANKDKNSDDKAKLKAKGQLPPHQAKPQWHGLVKHLQKSNLLPSVVFLFSKKKCEEIANSLGAMQLLEADERRQTSAFVHHCIMRLKPADRILPQVERTAALLDRGIAVHHGGLLPLVKEMVEMLFGRGLVKLLFATETFAMGVNMPARAVVFGQLRKHDGNSMRDLLPGEYTQMAGRAGRRGLDTTGVVIIAAWGDPRDTLPPHELQLILCGIPMQLSSRFRLTYNMILNLLRVEDFKVQDMIKRSFGEYHSQRLLPEKRAKLAQNVADFDSMNAQIDCIRGGSVVDIENFYDTTTKLTTLEKAISNAFFETKRGDALLGAGRLAVIRESSATSTTSVTTATSSSTTIAPFKAVELNDGWSIRVLTMTFDRAGREAADVKRISLDQVVGVSSTRIKIDGPKVLSGDRAAVADALQKLSIALADFANGLPTLLEPLDEVKFAEFEIVENVQNAKIADVQLKSSLCYGCPKLDEHYAVQSRCNVAKSNVRQLQRELSDDNLRLMPDFDARLRVLAALDYIDPQRTVQLKGRVAREINTCDELVLTELIFNNYFAELSPAEAAALLSSFVFEERIEAAAPRMTAKLSQVCYDANALIRSLGVLQEKHRLPIGDLDEYVTSTMNTALVEVVYEWASQTPFAEICQLTEVQEGSIVRCIVRVGEACKELRNAARIMGEPKLLALVDAASALIKRDVVFTNSLYYENN